jgi:hypothetical protein
MLQSHFSRLKANKQEVLVSLLSREQCFAKDRVCPRVSRDCFLASKSLEHRKEAWKLLVSLYLLVLSSAHAIILVLSCDTNGATSSDETKHFVQTPLLLGSLLTQHSISPSKRDT